MTTTSKASRLRDAIFESTDAMIDELDAAETAYKHEREAIRVRHYQRCAAAHAAIMDAPDGEDLTR